MGDQVWVAPALAWPRKNYALYSADFPGLYYVAEEKHRPAQEWVGNSRRVQHLPGANLRGHQIMIN